MHLLACMPTAGMEQEHPVTSANVLRADQTQSGHSHARQSLACCPPRLLLAPVTRVPLAPERVQPQVSILDSDEACARSLAQMLQAEGFAAGTWASAAEFVAQPEPPLEGCVIAGATLPDMSGLELQRELAARQWPFTVIFLISAGDTTAAVRGMKAGAINCLPKPVERAELLEAVREALAKSHAMRARRAAQLRVRCLLESLTPREREVLDLAVAGLLVKQIAARLGTRDKTVKTHKGRLMRKMQVRTTLALVQLMNSAGLSPMPPAS